jgi:hypothetical protein
MASSRCNLEMNPTSYGRTWPWIDYCCMNQAIDLKLLSIEADKRLKAA